MKRVGVAGNRTRYQSERMLVREKVDAGQFEWYRDSKEIYYRLKHFA